MRIDETARFIKAIAALWPSFPVTPDETVPAWADLLKDESLEDCLESIRRFARSDQKSFAPAPQDVFKIVAEIRKQRAINAKAEEQQKRMRIEYDSSESSMSEADRKVWMRKLMRQAGFA